MRSYLALAAFPVTIAAVMYQACVVLWFYHESIFKVWKFWSHGGGGHQTISSGGAAALFLCSIATFIMALWQARVLCVSYPRISLATRLSSISLAIFGLAFILLYASPALETWP